MSLVDKVAEVFQDSRYQGALPTTSDDTALETVVMDLLHQ